MRRKKKVLHYPNGYPYVLFDVYDGKKHNYTLATTADHAEQTSKTSKPRVSPILVTDLIRNKGHKETNLFLRKFGATWVCKDGKVFYRELEQ